MTSPGLDMEAVRRQADEVLAGELYLFPVRHHSPAAARHLRAAMRQRRPKLVLIEGPSDADALIPHVIDPKTKPPIAIYSSFRDDGNVLGLAGRASPSPDIPARFPVWYPLLVYSPEYVAMKAARELGAEIAFIDLPSHALIDPDDYPLPGGEPEADEDGEADAVAHAPDAHTAPASWESAVVESEFYQTMARVAGYKSWDEAWDSLFEVGGRHPDHEAFRRDLAYFCGAARATSSPERLVRDGTLARERHMARTVRSALEARGLALKDAFVVCGGFHLFLDFSDPVAPPVPPEGTRFSTVVPYSYFRVSELSGYGAANRAPRYYQTVWEHMVTGDPEPFVAAMIEHVTAVFARGRHDGQALSSADAISVTQHARLLASLRGRQAPILDDVRDALVSCCCKGRPEEEGRPLLLAMTRTEVGAAVGRVTPALGHLPILHDFHGLVDELGLGEVMGKEQRLTLKLDLRDERDARRSAFLHRLLKLDVPLGEIDARQASHGGTLFREVWRLSWSPRIEAQLVERNLYGDSVETAALARLEEEIARDAASAGGTCRRLLESVNMRLPGLAARLSDAAGAAIDADRHFSSLCEALVHLSVLDRLSVETDLGREAIESLIGRSYARACLAIGEIGAIPTERQEETIGHLKSLAEAVLSGHHDLDRASFTDGVKAAALGTPVPFMQGAFAGILTELRELDEAELAARVAAFARSRPETMVLAGEFLDGAFAVSRTSLLLGADRLVGAIDELLRAAPWEAFLTMLPRVRHAFERLHERQRRSFADRVAQRYGLLDTVSITDVKETSAGAGARLAVIDARVAEILKDWTF